MLEAGDVIVAAIRCLLLPNDKAEDKPDETPKHGPWLSAAVMLAGATPSPALDQYGYDPSGRLMSIRYATELCAIYFYDPNGNLTLRISSEAPTTPSMMWGTGEWDDFDWTSAFHRDRWSEGGTGGCFKWDQ